MIAIDVNPAKEEWARKFGATDFINPRQLPEGKRIQDHLVELTDGGLDFTFDATGNVSCAHHKRMMQRFFSNLTIRFSFSSRLMLCGLRLRRAIKAGAFRPSLVSQGPERRFPHGREFNSNLVSWVFVKIVEHGDVVSNWSLDAFGEAVLSGE